jgi:hypothetical protein
VNFVSLEGFIAARAFVEVLRRAGSPPDRDRFIDAVESGEPFDLGLATTHTLSPTAHQFSDRVWPTFLRGGRFVSMQSWAELRGGGP